MPLYIQAQANAADAALNLCGTSYSSSPANIFTAYKGWVVTARIDTTLNPSTAPSPKWTRDAASLGVDRNAVSSESGCILCQAGAVGSVIYGNNVSAFFQFSANSSTGSTIPSPVAAGYYAAERRGPTDLRAFFRGVQIGSSATTSAAVASATFGYGATSLYAANATHIGAALGDTLNLALYNRLRVYMTAVGVP